MSELATVIEHMEAHLARNGGGRSMVHVSRAGLQTLIDAAKMRPGDPGTRTITDERYAKYVECELILNEMEPLMKRAIARPL